MTKKLNPLEDPPTATSSDEDDVETSEAGEASDDSSSSEEDAPIKIRIKSPSATTAAAPPAKSTAVSAAADSDSGSETETDSDSESTNPPNSGSGKTIALNAVNLKKKEDPTSSSATLALPAVKSGTKRPASEAAATTSTKRVKKDEESVKKPGGFQRLWSEEDEILVLQGMIDFKADTGKSPYVDTNAFYDFLKKSISFEVSKNQFMDKIRSLRKKYIGKEGRNEPSFVKAHDKKAFELSKFIWGPKGIALDSNVKSNGVSKKSVAKKKIDSVKQELVFVGGSSTNNGKKVEEDGGDDGCDWFDNSSLVRMIASLGVDEYYVKQQWSLVSVESKKIVEEKYKLLQAKELEFVLEKTKFLNEVASMFVEASKNKPLDT
ncbi:putative transcription factor [Arabidopsis thaliana]|uniref:Uncharacterized protein n=2 Tax=Arabidopsis TaxID=3701 RepID=A0A178WJA1_ARATH|nr:GLABROUS1 enhancer-binding protein family [Arabidopsis thaliana x Arabidopsis arenosa]OAP17605.1 hypothetical protein AXX17_AT1G54970 [Arabidopsis thaliana]